MQLSFLGNSYTTAAPAIEAIEIEQTLTFLGRQSVVKQQYRIVQQKPMGEELTFMGRRYTRA